MDVHSVATWLPDRLAEAAAAHRVPGAAVAVCAGGELVEAAYGVLNTRTGVDVTTDSLFQIGSVTKVWTASLVMQLVDEGRLDLDVPVRRYLPAFRVADEQAGARITARHLLTHTAGFEDDLRRDTGRGDEAIAWYVDLLTDVPQLFPPGDLYSYSNSGYVVLGRLVEVLRDQPYAAALRDHLFAPLELRHAATDAYEAILHRVAVGHLGPDPEPAPVWGLMAWGAPAGAMLATSAGDLVRFARMHLGGGVAGNGARVLSAASATAMRTPYVPLPYRGGTPGAQGLGWQIHHWDGGTVLAHDGDTVGQCAYLRCVPAAGVAVALLANTGSAVPLYRSIVGRVLRDLAGVRMPPPVAPPGEPVPVADTRRYTGRYENRMFRYDVSDEDGRLWLTTTPREVAARFGMPAERYEIVRLDGDAFVSAEPVGGQHATVAFVGADADGRARFLHQGRAARRVSG
ncbi:MAG TPA: serine hydrolase domain-containing protein [Natronosporangium sp.]|jgi:CubicO group peptidase (beta-lactamase class C family)